MIADGVNLATVVQQDELQRVLEDPGVSQKELWREALHSVPTVLNAKTSIEVFPACEQSKLWQSWYLWSKSEESAREAGTFNTFVWQLRISSKNALSLSILFRGWLRWMLPTRTLWKSETPLRCCKDLHVRSAWPWGTCTEALPHSWKIRLYCDFRQHQSSIAPSRDTCDDDMAWFQLLHAAVGSVDHVEVIVASL